MASETAAATASLISSRRWSSCSAIVFRGVVVEVLLPGGDISVQASDLGIAILDKGTGLAINTSLELADLLGVVSADGLEPLLQLGDLGLEVANPERVPQHILGSSEPNLRAGIRISRAAQRMGIHPGIPLG
jgi:hypothetical protein